MNLRNLLLGFIVILILTMNFVKAEETAPKPFTNSDIKRTLDSGNVQKFDGNKYMIVRRGTKRKSIIKTVVKEKKVYKKNALKLFVGYGPNDLDTSIRRADLDSDPIMGIGYQRMLSEDFSLEALGTTSETLLIGGGYHF